jgi:hypothetical protein
MTETPALSAELVNEFVGVAHGNFERLKEMLEEEPNLINAAWDWGGGDWETSLGAAAHMGRADIAFYLLARGARLDIFAAAMLGKLDIVKAAVEDNPNIVNVTGPHGIPLIAHAKAGGENAASVLRFLESKTQAKYE